MTRNICVGIERLAVFDKTRREIGYLEAPGWRLEFGPQDIRILDVALNARFAVGRTDHEFPTVGGVQKCREHRVGVESRQAAPDDFAGISDDCRELTVSDYAQIFKIHSFRLGEAPFRNPSVRAPNYDAPCPAGPRSLQSQSAVLHHLAFQPVSSYGFHGMHLSGFPHIFPRFPP